MVSSPVAGSAKCLKGVTGLRAEVELRLVRWIKDSERRGKMPAGYNIQNKAGEIAKELKITDIQYSMSIN